MPDQPLRADIQDVPILDLQMNRFTTVKTRSVDLNYLTGEEPADRQRFESSLAKPFLFTADGDSILIG